MIGLNARIWADPVLSPTAADMETLMAGHGKRWHIGHILNSMEHAVLSAGGGVAINGSPRRDGYAKTSVLGTREFR